MFTYGVFFKVFQEEFGWSRAVISGASSLNFLLLGGFGIIAGALNDRIGPRIVMTVSGVLMGLGYLLLSRLEEPWQLYLYYGALVGIGLSTHDVITLSTVARWFERRRGTMTGLVKVGTGAGQFLMPLVAAFLITSYGWRNAYVMIGSVGLVVLVLLALPLIRDPQDMGLLPDNRQSTSQDLSENAAQSLSLSAALGTLQFWTICLAEFTIFFCLFSIVVHIVPHARDLHIRATSAAALLSTIGGVSMLGRITMGTAIDRIGGKRAMLFSLALLITSLLLLLTADNLRWLLLFSIIYGFAHGGLFTVISPTVAELFGTGAHGALFGLVWFSGAVGGSIGPWLAGFVFDKTDSYRLAFIILIMLALTGLGLVASLRPLSQTHPKS
jgi:MFS family permease